MILKHLPLPEGSHYSTEQLHVNIIGKCKLVYFRQSEGGSWDQTFANELYDIFFDRSTVIDGMSQLSCKNTKTFHQSQLLEVIAPG